MSGGRVADERSALRTLRWGIVASVGLAWAVYALAMWSR